MAYCRITGKSRGLPKPNYFPLLPPISAAAAKRYCRITGKSYGLPSHNFIPVILTANLSQKVQCKITTHDSGTAPLTGFDGDEYGHRKHVLLPDYRYLFPRWDAENNAQKELLGLLQSTELEDQMRNHNYVYRVDERACTLVFPATLETAIRDGNVRDVMMAKDSDRILLKMRKGTNVSVEMLDWGASVDNGGDSDSANKWATLFDGEGPRPEIILEREKEERLKKRRQKKMRQMAKMFTGNLPKEDPNESFPPTKTGKSNKIDTKRLGPLIDPSLFAEKQQFIDRIKGTLGSCVDLVKPLIESWDWKTYEQMANSKFSSKSSVELPKPIHIDPLEITKEWPTVPHATTVLENTVGFDAVPHVAPLADFKVGSSVVSEALLTSIRRLSAGQLAATDNAIEKLESDVEQLPTLEDIPRMLEQLKSGKFGHLAGVSGLKLDINKAHETFIAGQNISTPAGELFVPGTTIATSSGPVYVPGITVNTPGVGVSFVPGLVTNPDTEGEKAKFIAGQIIGDKFVPGQTMGTGTEPRFCEGQTITAEDGQLQFVPGIVHENEFIAGQTLNTSHGPKFVCGQTVTIEGEGDQFFAGRSVQDETGNWTFVDGQNIESPSHVLEFVPGKTIKTVEGTKFVAGQTIDGKFMPGIQRKDENGEITFISGVNVDTEKGPKFIQGMVTESEFGPIFMPGIFDKNVQGSYDFKVAQNMNEIIGYEVPKLGLAIDPHTCEVSDTGLLNVFGYMVQTENGGIEFYPEKVPVEHRLEGKAIPGRLFKQGESAKFIPGIMSEDKQSFIAGQVVSTENGEQFVPGQVVETEDDGLKFVPGQVIHTKAGSKFVPGQTFETPDGPRFVPGQIVQTRNGGPTFIPGQVIFTDGCERFVPGQVVETEDGPRFVPGRVVEEDDRVTFIPGQIVETADGPRFIASDMSDNEDEEQNFSVQSFLVSPEELKLIKPKGYAVHDVSGDLSVDANLLRQLSEAGMSVGRQIEMSAVDLVLQSKKDEQCMKNIEKAFADTPKELVAKSIEAVKSVIGFLRGDAQCQLPAQAKSKANVKNHVDHVKSAEVEEVLKSIYRKMSGTKSSSFYELLESELLGRASTGLKLEDVAAVIEGNPLQLVNKLHDDIEIEHSLDELVRLCSKNDRDGSVSEEQTMSALKRAIHDENIICSLEVIVKAQQQNTDEAQPSLVQEIAQAIGREKSGVAETSNRRLNELVIAHVQEEINRQIAKMCLDSKSGMMDVILMDTIQLAKALEVAPETVNQLLELREAPLPSDVVLGRIRNNPQVAELLSRTFLIRQIIANSADSQEEDLMQQLRSSPYSIRSNSHFLNVFRKSGALLVDSGLHVPESQKGPLKSSHEFPAQVLYNDNPLVIEDYLLKRKTKTRDALVIIKDTYKAVVPRHLSHAVLTGKCSYTLLDEHGMRHFEPLNVLDALVVLKRMPTIKKRFATYQQCKIEADCGPAVGGGGGVGIFVNGREDDDDSVGKNRSAESDKTVGISAPVPSCNTFGQSRRFDSSSVVAGSVSMYGNVC